MQLLEFFDAFVRPLEQSGLHYFATGSVASILYGEPRMTHDIDVVIHIRPQDIATLVQTFPEERYYCPPPEVIRIEIARSELGHFNIIDQKTFLKADLYPVAQDSLHQWALKTRRRFDLGEGLAIWVAPPEYVIIRKLEYFRMGGSSKHTEDIRKMLPQLSQDIRFDLAFLNEQLLARELQATWKSLQGV